MEAAVRRIGRQRLDRGSREDTEPLKSQDPVEMRRDNIDLYEVLEQVDGGQ